MQFARISLKARVEEAHRAYLQSAADLKAVSRYGDRRGLFFFGRIASHCSSVQSSIAEVLAPPPPDCSDLAAVDHDRVAVDVGRAVAHQEGREIGRARYARRRGAAGSP